MILFQNETNKRDFTLTESTTLSADSVYYLFQLFSPVTKEHIYFTAPNISTNVARYDRFNITLTGQTSAQTLTNGIIYAQPNGRWLMNVFQMTGQTNLSLTGVTGGAIETLWIHISGGTAQNYITNQYTGGTQYLRYYQPNSF